MVDTQTEYRREHAIVALVIAAIILGSFFGRAYLGVGAGIMIGMLICVICAWHKNRWYVGADRKRYRTW